MPETELAGLRAELRAFLRLDPVDEGVARIVEGEAITEDGFTRKAISYLGRDGHPIAALLFEPTGPRRRGGVVVLHQHNSEWAIGKSEIAGIAGDRLQAFGPALARLGVPVLAADALGFESRRGVPGHGTELGPRLPPGRGSPEGWLQYYNHAMHRLVRGELLMTKVLSDVELSVSVLGAVAGVTPVGMAGHSYGGNVAVFAAALDPRIAFACSSGAACSYRHKLAQGTGLEMALVIPGFAARYDVDDLMRCIAPRRLLVVSSESDPYAADAGDLVARARPAFTQLGGEPNLEHLHLGTGHALDHPRFEAIVGWLVAQAGE